MSFPLPDNILQLPDIAVKQIMQRVAVLQNGDVSKVMKKAGYNYGINYGVSIPQLRDLATRYKADKALACQLRQHANIREALILSSMLDEPNKLSLIEALEICEFVDNVELIEQFSRNLFAHQIKLLAFCKKILSESEMHKTICFMSIAWAIKFKKFRNISDVDWLIEQLNNLESVENPKIAKAIMFAMQAIETELPDYSKRIRNMAEKFSKSDNSSFARLGNEFLWLNAI